MATAAKANTSRAIRLEIAWTVLPLIAVVIFGYIGVTSLRTVTAAEENEVVVDVEGFQWAWAFTYPDTGAASADLVLPVNQPAVMEMTSRVCHPRFVLGARVPRQAGCGARPYRTVLRFTPTVEGEYTLVCAKLCGLTHYNMIAKVKIVSQEEYAQWQQVQLAAMGKTAATAGSIDVAQGDAPAVDN